MKKITGLICVVVLGTALIIPTSAATVEDAYREVRTAAMANIGAQREKFRVDLDALPAEETAESTERRAYLGEKLAETLRRNNLCVRLDKARSVINAIHAIEIPRERLWPELFPDAPKGRGWERDWLSGQYTKLSTFIMGVVFKSGQVNFRPADDRLITGPNRDEIIARLKSNMADIADIAAFGNEVEALLRHLPTELSDARATMTSFSTCLDVLNSFRGVDFPADYVEKATTIRKAKEDATVWTTFLQNMNEWAEEMKQYLAKHGRVS